MQPDGEDGSFREKADLSWIRTDSCLCWGKDRSLVEFQNANSVKNRNPTALDRFTDPIPLGMIDLHQGPNITDMSFVFVVFSSVHIFGEHALETG